MSLGDPHRRNAPICTLICISWSRVAGVVKAEGDKMIPACVRAALAPLVRQRHALDQEIACSDRTILPGLHSRRNNHRFRDARQALDDQSARYKRRNSEIRSRGADSPWKTAQTRQPISSNVIQSPIVTPLRSLKTACCSKACGGIDGGQCCVPIHTTVGNIEPSHGSGREPDNVSTSDGHDSAGHIDEFVPGEAAVVKGRIPPTPIIRPTR